MSQYEGFAHISQGVQFLTEYENQAVTSLNSVKGTSWNIKVHGDSKDSDAQLILTLASGLLADGKEEKVLTLGEKTEDPAEGIKIYLAPLECPVSERQLWTFEKAAILESEPPIVRAHIQSVAEPGLWAGTNIIPQPLPRLYTSVAAVPSGKILDDEDKRWKIGYFRP